MTIAVFYMFLTALMATLLYVILKYFATFKINTLHGLTVNYLTAATWSFCLNLNQSTKALDKLNDISLVCLGIGLLFITTFYITSISTERHGIAITSIAGKMSMVIPIAAGFMLYNESVTFFKLIGIILALSAVYISNNKKNGKGINQLTALPLMLFIGSGLVDTFIKMSQHYLINENNKQLFIAGCFGAAGLFGILMTLYLRWTKQIKIELKSIVAGIILGSVNYFSLDFLIQCLSLPDVESSSAFAVINMLVVILSGIFAFLLFKEPPAKTTIAGILLAIVAITILSL